MKCMTSWRNRSNNTANTRHWAQKYLRWSCSKPIISRDTSHKCPLFSSRQKHATYTNDLPQAYRTTKNGDPFLVYDNEERRIQITRRIHITSIIRITEHIAVFRRFRALVCWWYVQGLPGNFLPIVLHGQCDRRIFPCVFLLLPNKNKNTYNGLFE